jgi:hypothetical protein
MNVVGQLTFDRHTLERSLPLDPLRVLASDKGAELVDVIGAEIDAIVPRRRARRGSDAARWRHSLDVMLANLVLAAFNRIDSARFIAVSFNVNDYSSTPLSSTALAWARDGLVALGMIEGRRGYRHVVNGAVRHARRTRLRATPALRSRFAWLGLGRNDVGWHERRDTIILRGADPDVPPEPVEVQASRPLLDRLNRALGRTWIHLPDDAWERVVERVGEAPLEGDDRLVAGEGATSLYRIFKCGWDRGGRLYGGWWINLPEVERQKLMLDGAAVVERDFARLHPTMLFARAEIILDFDIYAVPGYAGEAARELGKRTFNRLINKTVTDPLRLPATALDRAQLPQGVRYSDYLSAFIRQLAPIARWFGTGEGLRLQREDSDLAIAILSSLLDQDVLALPVHDSFIVARRNEAALVATMRAEFASRYGFEPTVR